MPELMLCAERRAAALLELDWTIRPKDSKKARGYDSVLAEEQTACLLQNFYDAEDQNLFPAIEHLASAFFRGFAISVPVFSADSQNLKGFQNLDAWNICISPDSGEIYWNPDCQETTKFADILEVLPVENLTILTRSKHIDYPALQIYIRAAMGEDLYSKFLSRYGIPPVLLTLPEKIQAGKVAEFAAKAKEIYRGGTGALPFGTTVNWASAPAGVAPFESFLSYQTKQIILLATGGLATSLDALGGLGSSVGDAHQTTWQTIVQRDAAIVATALNKSVTSRLLNANFPGRPHLASFDFETQKPASPKEVFELAILAKNAGWQIEQKELEQRTGYTLIRDTSAASTDTPPVMYSNSATSATVRNDSTESTTSPTSPEDSEESEESTEKEFEKSILETRRIIAERIAELIKDGKQIEDPEAVFAELEAQGKTETEEAFEKLLATKFVDGVRE